MEIGVLLIRAWLGQWILFETVPYLVPVTLYQFNQLPEDQQIALVYAECTYVATRSQEVYETVLLYLLRRLAISQLLLGFRVAACAIFLFLNDRGTIG